MKFNFEDKRVLVTGSTRGIGQAAAEAFLEAGARVAINGRTGQSVTVSFGNLGYRDRVVAAPGDIETVSGCETVVRTAIETMGGLDILVNSAGVGEDLSIEDTDEAVWDKTLDVNLKGTFFCCKNALQALRVAKGNIVNVASDAGLMGCDKLSAYCASKAGVVNMTRALAIELAPDVRINCVCPGYVDTDMVRRDIIEQDNHPEAMEQILKDYAPLKRIATPGEIAHSILYLASEDARFVTGSALQIDGGTTAGH